MQDLLEADGYLVAGARAPGCGFGRSDNWFSVVDCGFPCQTSHMTETRQTIDPKDQCSGCGNDRIYCMCDNEDS